MAENYLVSYEQRLRDSITYRSSYTVYIYQSEGKGLYLVKEPYLNPELGATVAEAISSLSTWLAPSPVIPLDPLGYLFAELKRAGFIDSSLTEDDLKAASHYLMREILGYSTVDPLIRDPEIEDISCEGLGRPVKVWHRKFNSNGWLESNVSFPSTEKLDATVSRLVHRSNRSLSVSSPIVDCVLPEGYRLAATWGKEVTSLGSSFSIRKLRAIPYTISELIHAGMLDAKIAAHLWMLLEMSGFVVIAGVTASGKTTLLNALGTVINPNWKVLSIEDTREINLPQSGWKPLHTKHTQADGLQRLALRPGQAIPAGETRLCHPRRVAGARRSRSCSRPRRPGPGCLTTFHVPNTEAIVRPGSPSLHSPSRAPPSTSSTLSCSPCETRRARGTCRKWSNPGGEWVTVFRRAGNRGDAWEGIARALRQAREEGRRLSGTPAKRVSAELERRTKFLDQLVGKGVTDYESLSKELRRFYVLASSTLTL